MENENTSVSKSKKPLILVIGGVAVAVGIFLVMQTGILKKLGGSLLGPPQVVLEEKFAKEGAATFDHSKFDALLKAHVDGDGWVDYTAFKTDEAKLDEYLEFD